MTQEGGGALVAVLLGVMVEQVVQFRRTGERQREEVQQQRHGRPRPEAGVPVAEPN